jgi:chromosome segregation ATPase
MRFLILLLLTLACGMLMTAGCSSQKPESQQQTRLEAPEDAELRRLNEKVAEFDRLIEASKEVVSAQTKKLAALQGKLRTRQTALAQIRDDISDRRELYDKLQSQSVRDSVVKQLEKLLKSYKAEEAAVAEMTKTVQIVRSGYDAVKAASDELQTSRDELSRQLEILEVKLDAAKIQGELARTELGKTALKEAKELSDALEVRVEVQRRLLNEQQSVDLEALLKDPVISQSDIAELDKILGK